MITETCGARGVMHINLRYAFISTAELNLDPVEEHQVLLTGDGNTHHSFLKMHL